MAKQMFNEFMENPTFMKMGLSRIEIENLNKMKEYMDKEEGRREGKKEGERKYFG